MIARADVEGFLLGYLPYMAAVDRAVLSGEFTKGIAAAATRLRGSLQVCFEPTVIKMKPEDGLTKGTGPDDDYQLEEPALDFTQEEITRDSLPRWTLRHRPVISVERLRFMIGSREVYAVPESWLQVDKDMGILSLLPDGLTSVSISTNTALMWAPLLDGSGWRFKIMPNMIAVDYTAGWADFDTDDSAAEVREILAKEAACRVLDRCRHLIPATTALDGFNQAFGAMQEDLKTWQEDINKFIRGWRVKYTPPVVRVL